MRVAIFSHGHPTFSKGGAEIAAYHLFNGINPRVLNVNLPNTYTLYKGVNLFNCKTNDGKYIRFEDLDLSIPNYIYNALPTSTSTDLIVAYNFVKYDQENCILRIKVMKKHKVL
jgi:hypothetical protein